MTFALAFLAYLVLPVAGLMTWRIESVRRMDLGGRIAIAGAAGAVAMGAAMFVLSAIGVPWTRATLFIVLAILGAAGFTHAKPARTSRNRAVSAAIAVWIILAAYGAIDARESSGDLHYFWGPKAVRFYGAKRIDADFLRDRVFYSMHPDYPPLVPLLYAWSAVIAQRFSWWAALATAPLLLLGTGAVVRSSSGDDLGALLVVATLGQAMALGYAAGAADPLLVFFETIALAALVFIDEPRDQSILAAIGLAGAAWTKIEGTTFVIAVVVALLLARREWKRTALIAAPAAALIAAWTIFIGVEGITDMYAAAGRYPIYPHTLPATLRLMLSAASYNVAWIPWLAPLALIVIGDVRRAAVPLLVCVLTIGAAIYFYLHAADATWWIASSAHRVLMTPLVALDIAAIEATRRRTSSVVPIPSPS
jgi:hypothetical protein